jgi:hypothetical protein
MPDDTRDAIGVIDALNEAGLLRASPTSQPAASGAVGIINALNVAGLLGTPSPAGATGAPEPPPQPPEAPKPADQILTGEIKQVLKYVDLDAGGSLVTSVFLTSVLPDESWRWTYLKFPPNDEKWLMEFDRILAAPKPLEMQALAEVTAVISPGYVEANLLHLEWASTW